MLEKFVLDTVVSSANVGFNGKMGVADLLEAFQYAVTLHTEQLGVAYDTVLEKYNAKWVIAKLRMEFSDFPKNKDKIQIQTWPHKAGAIKFGRSFLITGERDYAVGYSDWCVIDADTFQMKRAREIEFPPLDYIEDKPCSKYSNVKPSESTLVYSRTMRVSDLDINNHVNNVSYVTMAMDCLSSAEISQTEIKSFEAHFTSQCFEGETLDFYREDRDGVIIITAKKKQENVFIAVINS